MGYQDNWFASQEAFLSILALLFGLVALALYVFATLRIDKDTLPDFRRYYVVLLLIVAVLLVIFSGLNDKQIAPAIGFFATVAGYILGRSSARADT